MFVFGGRVREVVRWLLRRSDGHGCCEYDKECRVGGIVFLRMRIDEVVWPSDSDSVETYRRSVCHFGC